MQCLNQHHFQAFRQHSQQHPLSAPGTADLTADVDFSLLTASLADSVMAIGPVNQAFFLKNMGIEIRLMVRSEYFNFVAWNK